jgi:protoheme IX farnesyltransferase
MKAVTLLPEPVETRSRTVPLPAVTARLVDYVALTKPRVAVLVLFTVGAGVLLASAPIVPLDVLFHAVFGTALVASGASALNQWLERGSDARMRRTCTRPLPAGRLSPLEVVVFGCVLGAGGVAYLLWMLDSPAAGLLALFTFAAYVGVYTPLKRYTTLNTLIGAVPGAMPPVIGWCAVSGHVDAGALALFVVLFVWQVPHFLAIAWMYRGEYARARLCMLPVIDRDGRSTARQMVLYCLALVPTSLGPVLLHSAGVVYTAGALLLGLYFLLRAWQFTTDRTVWSARRVLRASLVYLPGLLLVLLFDRLLNTLVLGR